ncbi:iron chelate uptake ABC transporter family permease subunit [Streptosporangium sp. NPDC051022]|uniref:FecCD family ABC transporter permease n=1 Tax=Streptosporangium sp. NPDC051022 TaxID=3155752 RepID=UPI00343FADDE
MSGRSRRAGRTARPLIAGAGLAAVTALLSVYAIGVGDVPLTPAEVVATLLGRGDAAAEFVVMTLRVPRVVIALLVGAALGVSGAVFQSLSRNPLGSPDVIGFTTGAATGAIVQILVIGGGPALLAGSAVGGGVAAAGLVYLLAYRRGVQGQRMVLIGIGVSAMLYSVNSFLITRAEVTAAQRANAWLFGSLNGRGWEHVGMVAVALAVLLPPVLALGPRMSLLEMGDDVAGGLGVPAERTRLTLMLAAVGLCATATAAVGPLEFVALTAPQLARRLTRTTGSGLVTSALMGGALLLAADVAAQRVPGSGQVPVGVMTAAIGGCYLAYLLSRRR